MPRNTSGLKRNAGPGRPKGSQNKLTVAMKVWAQEILDSPAWRASALQRMVEGKAAHLESHIMQVVLPKTDQTKHGVDESLAELILRARGGKA